MAQGRRLEKTAVQQIYTAIIIDSDTLIIIECYNIWSSGYKAKGVLRTVRASKPKPQPKPKPNDRLDPPPTPPPSDDAG